jgi:hypothetical protein
VLFENSAVPSILQIQEMIAEIIITNQRGSIIVYLMESVNLGTKSSGLALAPYYLFLLKRSLSSPIIPESGSVANL